MILPSGDYNPALTDDPKNLEAKQADIDDQKWRLVYFFPIIINCVNLSCFYLFIKYDSIMFSLSKGDDEGALALVDKIYHRSCDRQEIVKELKKQCKKKDHKTKESSYFE